MCNCVYKHKHFIWYMSVIFSYIYKWCIYMQDSFINSISLAFGRGHREFVRVIQDGWPQENNVFQKQQHCCTYEIIETVVAHTRSAQVQIRYSPSTNGKEGGEYELPFLANTLAFKGTISILQWNLTEYVNHR